MNIKTHVVHRGQGFVKTALVAATLLTGGQAFAQWQVLPVLKVGGEYDDNATLQDRTDREIELNGYLLGADLGLQYDSERTNFLLRPRVIDRNYSDNPELESTDLFLHSRYSHQFRSSSVGFRVNYDNQTVRTAERVDVDPGEDPDDIPGDSTGRVGLLGDREKWRFVPSYRYNFSASSSLDVNLDYFDVAYEDVFAGILTDYRDARLNLTYRNAMSNRNTLVFNASGRQFEADDLQQSEVDGYGLVGGVERDITSTTRLRALIGVETAEQEAQNTTEVVGEVRLTQRLETINLLAQYRRSLNASGAGRVSRRDQVNFNLSRRLNQRISAGIGVRAYHSEGLGTTVSIEDRNYVQLQSQFTWHLSEAFVIEADYRYTVLDRGDAIGERANSNNVTLWFVWQPNTIVE